jgi:hypothetical protein
MRRGLLRLEQASLSIATVTRIRSLFENVNVFLRADLRELVGPHGSTNLANLSLLQQQHAGAGLTAAAADAERNFIVHHRPGDPDLQQ